MIKFMNKQIVAALMIGALVALPSCGCRKEEVIITTPDMTKAVDVQDVQITEVAPAVEAAPVVETDAAQLDVK